MRYLRMLSNSVAAGVLVGCYVLTLVLQLNPDLPAYPSRVGRLDVPGSVSAPVLDGERDAGKLVLDGGGDAGVDPIGIAAHIELEELRISGCGGGDLLEPLFKRLVSCSGLRQITHETGCSHTTIARHLARLGRHCLLFHERHRPEQPSEELVLDGFRSLLAQTLANVATSCPVDGGRAATCTAAVAEMPCTALATALANDDVELLVTSFVTGCEGFLDCGE